MTYSENEKNIRQNLIDAGCTPEQTEKFMQKLNNGDIKNGLKQLFEHRCCLLDDLHKEQKCIDCLDYLIYMIKKENMKNEAD